MGHIKKNKSSDFHDVYLSEKKTTLQKSMPKNFDSEKSAGGSVALIIQSKIIADVHWIGSKA